MRVILFILVKRIVSQDLDITGLDLQHVYTDTRTHVHTKNTVCVALCVGLEKAGIGEVLRRWMEYYQRERTQRTHVRGAF